MTDHLVISLVFFAAGWVVSNGYMRNYNGWWLITMAPFILVATWQLCWWAVSCNPLYPGVCR